MAGRVSTYAKLSGSVIIGLAPIALLDLPLSGKILVVLLNKVIDVVVEGVDVNNIQVVRGNELVISVVSLTAVLSLFALSPGSVKVIWPIQPGDKSENLR